MQRATAWDVVFYFIGNILPMLFFSRTVLAVEYSIVLVCFLLL